MTTPENAEELSFVQTENSEQDQSKDSIDFDYDWLEIKLLCSAKDEYKPTEACENFTKGCHWSPDGTCLLVPGEDNRVRIYEPPKELDFKILPENWDPPELESSLSIREGGTIYDSCWFPFMSSRNPDTCCFLTAAQENPVHLWDAFSGQLRATYRAYNQVDEVEPANSVQFTQFGKQIWSGCRNQLMIFDSNRPGRQIQTISLKKDFSNLSGIVSCIRDNPSMPSLVAFGTYSKNIGLYKDGPLCSFKTANGVSQIEFSSCGTRLYSACRKSGEFLCWDLRQPGTVLYCLQGRQSDSNQRIHFNLPSERDEVISGGTDGFVRIWKIPANLQVEENLEPYRKIHISKDCVNGVNLHKTLPILAVSLGQRICDEELLPRRENGIKFCWLNR